MQRSNVLLPDPLEPMMLSTWPLRAVKDTPCNTSWLPERLCRFLSCSGQVAVASMAAAPSLPAGTGPACAGRALASVGMFMQRSGDEVQERIWIGLCLGRRCASQRFSAAPKHRTSTSVIARYKAPAGMKVWWGGVRSGREVREPAILGGTEASDQHQRDRQVQSAGGDEGLESQI